MSDAEAQTPPCAICGRWREGRRALHHLTHGVSLWLCDPHRSESYLHRDGGYDFVARATTVWAAAGALTKRRQAALRTHLRRLDQARTERELPGSYSWPALRREAERRFATGEPPKDVIADLRCKYADAPSVVPSVRTMRRWFTQARWLTTPIAGKRRRKHPRPQRYGPLTPGEQLVNLLLTGYGNQPRNRNLVRGP